MASTTITVRVEVDLVRQLDALAERLSAHGKDTCAPAGAVTRTAAARLALRRGIAALDDGGVGQPSRSPTSFTVHLPDLDEIDDTMQVLERLADVRLDSDHVEVIEALGDLDVDMLRALRRLDTSTLDALAMIDAGQIEALDQLANGSLGGFLDQRERLSADLYTNVYGPTTGTPRSGSRPPGATGSG